MSIPSTPDRMTTPVEPNAPMRSLSSRRGFVSPLNYENNSIARNLENHYDNSRHEITIVLDGLYLMSQDCIQTFLDQRSLNAMTMYTRPLLIISVTADAPIYSSYALSVNNFDEILQHIFSPNVFLPNDEYGISQLIMAINDTPMVAEEFSKFFVVINDLIAKRMDLGYEVLVHCHAGVSRSPTLILAYLMQSKKMTFSQAMDFLQIARPCVELNFGFHYQLQKLETEMQFLKTYMHEQAEAEQSIINSIEKLVE